MIEVLAVKENLSKVLTFGTSEKLKKRRKQKTTAFMEY